MRAASSISRSIPLATSRSNVNDASSRRPSSTASFPATTVWRLAAVRHEREAVALEGEVALMGLHRGLDDAPRKRQEALVEFPFEHGRPLGQVDDLGQHPLVRLGQPELLEAGADRGVAPPLVRLHIGPTHRLEVGAGRRDRHLPVRDAVTVGRATEALHGLLVELGAEPAHRPGEAEPGVVPAHRLREGETADDLVEPLGQRIEERTARHEHPQEAVADLQLVHAHTLFLREALRRLFPQMLGRPLDPLVGLALGQVGHEQREPARADEDPSVAELRQLGTELRLRLLAGRGGELLAADLKQQARQCSPRRAGQPCARASAPGRCRRRAPSPRWRRAHPAG